MLFAVATQTGFKCRAIKFSPTVLSINKTKNANKSCHSIPIRRDSHSRSVQILLQNGTKHIRQKCYDSLVISPLRGIEGYVYVNKFSKSRANWTNLCDVIFNVCVRRLSDSLRAIPIKVSRLQTFSRPSKSSSASIELQCNTKYRVAQRVCDLSASQRCASSIRHAEVKDKKIKCKRLRQLQVFRCLHFT